MVEIVFQQEFPDNFREHTEELIRKCELLFPCWVQTVYVNWGGDADEGIYASMSVDFDYRMWTTTLYRGLLAEPFDRQFSLLLHELLHCYNAPIGDLASDILDRMLPDGPEAAEPLLKELYHIYDKRIREVVERANVDFTHALVRYTESLTGGPT